MAVSVMVTGGTFCYGQAEQPAVRDTLPNAQGAAADRAGASDRATGAQPAAGRTAAGAHGDMPGMAMGGQQVDQQVQQQLQKFQQQKEMVPEKLFVLHAGLGGMFEMALAQQAQQKSQDPQVKQVAQRILQDHQQANQQLMQVAQKVQVDLPKGLTSMKQQELQVIGSLESKEYDQKFITCMDELHARDVAMFRNASQMAKQQDVKQFAAQTLPKLREHHQQIKQSATALGLSSDMEAQPAGSRIPGSTTPREGVSPGSSTPGTSTPGSTTPGGSSGNTVPGSAVPGQSDAQRTGSNPKVPSDANNKPTDAPRQ